MSRKKKKSILIVAGIPGFDIDRPNSAVANYLKIIKNNLTANNFDVAVFPSGSNGPGSLGTASGSDLKKQIKRLFKKYFGYIYHSLILNRLFKFHKALMQHISGKEYDLIIEFYTLGSDLGTGLKKTYGSKLLLIYDNPVLVQFNEMHHSSTFYDKKIKKLEAEAIAQADCILCYSATVEKYIRETFRTKAVFFQMPCIVWKNKRPKTERFEGNRIVIGFVGSFLNWHNVPLLMKAFETIAQEYDQAQLVLVGFGEEWEHVKRLREESVFRNRITMTGYVSDEELEEWKSKFTMGVMPGSNWYGSPLKLFEYAESGIPIIAPSSPVINDLFVPGENVLQIDGRDELKSLVSNIRLLIQDKSVGERISRNASELMNGAYSERRLMDNFSILVENLVKNGSEG